MLTKQPDYIISELGYPQWQQLCEEEAEVDNRLHKKCRPPTSSSSSSYGHNSSRCYSSNSSPSYSSSSNSNSSSSLKRLLPLRETLDDYYKRLLLSEQRSRAEHCNARDLDDVVAQQKRHKNQWNVQQQRANNNNNNNNHRRNQNCRDKAQTTATTTTTMKATLVTCDLNSF